MITHPLVVWPMSNKNTKPSKWLANELTFTSLAYQWSHWHANGLTLSPLADQWDHWQANDVNVSPFTCQWSHWPALTGWPCSTNGTSSWVIGKPVGPLADFTHRSLHIRMGGGRHTYCTRMSYYVSVVNFLWQVSAAWRTHFVIRHFLENPIVSQYSQHSFYPEKAVIIDVWR